MRHEKLTDIVDDIKSQDALIEWELQLKAESIYEFSREKQGVCKARLYIDREKDKFVFAYIVVNPLGKIIENGKGHYSKIKDFKKHILNIIYNLNNTYFTQQLNQGHNVQTQQSNS